MKYSTVSSILIIYAIDITFAAVSILYVLGDNQLAIAIYHHDLKYNKSIF